MARKAFQVVDARTAKSVASFDTRDQAMDDADRRDAEFGAVRFRVERDAEVMTAAEFSAFMSRVSAEQVSA